MAIMKNVTVYWAKVLGDPVPKYIPEDGREWAIDLCFTDDQVKVLKSEGVTVEQYVKDKGDDRGKHFTYRRNEFRKDGEKSKPLRILALDGSEWPKDKLIGNGTVVDINYSLNEIPARPKNRVKPSLVSMMIREHKPYESKGQDEFEFEAKPAAKVEEEWAEN